MAKTNTKKALIAAILAAIAAILTWTAFYIDGDETTTPDTGAVIEAVGGVGEAVGAYKDEKAADGAVVTE